MSYRVDVMSRGAATTPPGASRLCPVHLVRVVRFVPPWPPQRVPGAALRVAAREPRRQEPQHVPHARQWSRAPWHPDDGQALGLPRRLRRESRGVPVLRDDTAEEPGVARGVAAVRLPTGDFNGRLRGAQATTVTAAPCSPEAPVMGAGVTP